MQAEIIRILRYRKRQGVRRNKATTARLLYDTEERGAFPFGSGYPLQVLGFASGLSVPIPNALLTEYLRNDFSRKAKKVRLDRQFCLAICTHLHHSMTRQRTGHAVGLPYHSTALLARHSRAT
jgi:hypothetical protein